MSNQFPRSDSDGQTAECDRRTALAAMGGLGLFAAGAAALGAGGDGGGAGSHGACPVTSDLGAFDAGKGEYVLAKLPYDYGALEPHIDARTMEIHHSKHHAAYVAGLNKALGELAKARDAGDFALVKHWSREASFHGGGHVNHAIFWAGMAPPDRGGGGAPSGALGTALARDFGSLEKFTAHFTAAAVAVEGAGWAWLVLDSASGRLMVQQMEKQQNMLLTGCVPLVGIDVWEHAYYLRYQNRRADYVKAWWNVVNWGRAQRIFEVVAG